MKPIFSNFLQTKPKLQSTYIFNYNGSFYWWWYHLSDRHLQLFAGFTSKCLASKMAKQTVCNSKRGLYRLCLWWLDVKIVFWIDHALSTQKIHLCSIQSETWKNSKHRKRLWYFRSILSVFVSLLMSDLEYIMYSIYTLMTSCDL